MESKEHIMDLEKYLKDNPDDLTMQQKVKLRREVHAEARESGVLSDEMVDYRLWLEKLPSRCESFADYLSGPLMRYAGGTILEVGCGPRARLARSLLDRGYNVEAIDPKLEMRSRIFRRESFTIDYPHLDSFQAVIALEPCEATELVIRACTQQKVPFFVVPCGSPHPRIDGTLDKTTAEWWAYLMNLNSKIRISPIELDKEFDLPVLIYQP